MLHIQTLNVELNIGYGVSYVRSKPIFIEFSCISDLDLDLLNQWRKQAFCVLKTIVIYIKLCLMLKL